MQLRVATSSVEGTCSAPALTSDGPASACDRAGTTTYQLGESLGVITPISVVLPKDQGPAQSVILEFDKADTSTLADASREAIDKRLAALLDGRVFSAPVVKSRLTTSQVTLAFGTASEAKQVSAELGCRNHRFETERSSHLLIAFPEQLIKAASRCSVISLDGT